MNKIYKISSSREYRSGYYKVEVLEREFTKQTDKTIMFDNFTFGYHRFPKEKVEVVNDYTTAIYTLDETKIEEYKELVRINAINNISREITDYEDRIRKLREDSKLYI
jgi:hypothetical protein